MRVYYAQEKRVGLAQAFGFYCGGYHLPTYGIPAVLFYTS